MFYHVLFITYMLLSPFQHLSGVTCTVRKFVVFCQYSCEGTPMKVATTAETCRWL